ncbi:MAG: type II toxin-antitoxin system Phd/YefM family antitoxin [Dehalococcoidia bacterium]|nr:type II toxin-antitoxin system Phd/YefM family antitoxin [Dehalococcoidia bacterium]
MSEVSINDLKTKATEILRKVETDKEPVTITRRGKPIARIVPMEAAAPEKPGEAEMAAFGAMVGQMTEMFKGFGGETTITTTTPEGKTKTKRKKV